MGLRDRILGRMKEAQSKEETETGGDEAPVSRSRQEPPAKRKLCVTVKGAAKKTRVAAPDSPEVSTSGSVEVPKLPPPPAVPRALSQPEQLLKDANSVCESMRNLPRHSEVSISLSSDEEEEEGEIVTSQQPSFAAPQPAPQPLPPPVSLPSAAGPTPCRAWPSCRFGALCRFAHPLCRFDSYCTRPGCPHSHSNRQLPPVLHNTPAAAALVPVPNASGGVVANLPPTGYFAGLPISCKAGKDCNRPACPFRHPSAPVCRFGTNCYTYPFLRPTYFPASITARKTDNEPEQTSIASQIEQKRVSMILDRNSLCEAP